MRARVRVRVTLGEAQYVPLREGDVRRGAWLGVRVRARVRARVRVRVRVRVRCAPRGLVRG